MIQKIAQLLNSANTLPRKGDAWAQSRLRTQKNKFGKQINLARGAPVAVTNYGSPIVAVIAAAEYERLMALDAPKPARRPADQQIILMNRERALGGVPGSSIMDGRQ